MELQDRCAVVTGGGHGIGRALCEALAERGAKVVVADRDEVRAARVAAQVGGIAVACDVGERDAVHALAAAARDAFGPIEVFCSNAGVLDLGPGLDSSPEELRRMVDINVLAHVWAAQAVLPEMVERGRGWLLQTISSAALVSGPMDLGYTFTKHGALGVAEWIALNHAHLGISVTCLCPSAVHTGMLGRNEDDEAAGAAPAPTPSFALAPEVCAEQALEAMAAGRFLALPHPHVAESFRAKAADYDAWLAETASRLRQMREVS